MVTIKLSQNLVEVCNILIEKYSILNILFKSGEEMAKDLVDKKAVIYGFEELERKNNTSIINIKYNDIYKIGDYTTDTILKFYLSKVKIEISKILSNVYEKIETKLKELSKIYNQDMKNFLIVSKDLDGFDELKTIQYNLDTNELELYENTEKIKEYEKNCLEILNDKEFIENHILKIMLEQEKNFEIFSKEEIKDLIKKRLNENFILLEIFDYIIKDEIIEKIFNDKSFNYQFLFKKMNSDLYFVNKEKLKNLDLIQENKDLFKNYCEYFIKNKKELIKKVKKIIETFKNKKAKKFVKLEELNEKFNLHSDREDYEFLKAFIDKNFKEEEEKNLDLEEALLGVKERYLKVKENLHEDISVYGAYNVSVKKIQDNILKIKEKDSYKDLSFFEIGKDIYNVSLEFEFNEYFTKLRRNLKTVKEKLDIKDYFEDFENIKKKLKEIKKEPKEQEKLYKKESRFLDLLHNLLYGDFEIVKKLKNEQEEERYKEFKKELNDFLKIEIDYFKGGILKY